MNFSGGLKLGYRHIFPFELGQNANRAAGDVPVQIIMPLAYAD
jgi:hypothetical protein